MSMKNAMADNIRRDREAPLRARITELEVALCPFVEFLEAFERNPIASLDPDEVYSIHGGHGRPTCPEGASIRWDDLRAARAALHGKSTSSLATGSHD